MPDLCSGYEHQYILPALKLQLNFCEFKYNKDLTFDDPKSMRTGCRRQHKVRLIISPEAS